MQTVGVYAVLHPASPFQKLRDRSILRAAKRFRGLMVVLPLPIFACPRTICHLPRRMRHLAVVANIQCNSLKLRFKFFKGFNAGNCQLDSRLPDPAERIALFRSCACANNGAMMRPRPAGASGSVRQSAGKGAGDWVSAGWTPSISRWRRARLRLAGSIVQFPSRLNHAPTGSPWQAGAERLFCAVFPWLPPAILRLYSRNRTGRSFLARSHDSKRSRNAPGFS